MWAALKSPLLMGNDLRVLTPPAYSILNNPAVIAINQDPLGQSAYRVYSVITDPKDRFSIGEYQIWSGRLAHGDQVVLFLSFLDKDIEVSASLEDIFLHDGPGGSAWQVHKDWYIHDLWVDRMDEVLAKGVLDAQSSDTPERARILLNLMDWYNATEISYKEGLKQGDARLIGRKIGSVKADGAITATVKRHGVRMFRLTRNMYEKWPKDLEGMKGEL
jgi:alpha-galactosidase